MLVGNGQSTFLFPENELKDRIRETISNSIPRKFEQLDENQINIPNYLRDYCHARLRSWIDNAFRATEMKHGREYSVIQNDIFPIDYKSTGITETNKKWSDGLQQFLEMKHSLAISLMSPITNFLSNVDFFCRYKSNILGVSGTLGSDSEKTFMDHAFKVEFATIPTFKRSKFFELDAHIAETSSEWKSMICDRIKSELASQRAILLICQDIITMLEVYDSVSAVAEQDTIYTYYACDDLTNNYSEKYEYGVKSHFKRELKPRDVILTTNLGARGADFLTDGNLNKNGGLFVLLTFLPMNERVEKQAFGRTGRRGATGSGQIIVNRSVIPAALRNCESMDEMKRLRNFIGAYRLKEMMTEVKTMSKKQELFQNYCKIRQRFAKSSNETQQMLTIQLNSLDEEWAIWLQNYDIEQNKDTENETLLESFSVSVNRTEHKKSENIYHLLNYGTYELMKGNFIEAQIFFNEIIKGDLAWSAFAYYYKAYCTIKLRGDGYIRIAIADLNTALEKLRSNKEITLCTETFVYSSFIEMLSADFQEYMFTNIQLLHHIETQMNEIINKLEKLQKSDSVVTIELQYLQALVLFNSNKLSKRIVQEYCQLGFLFTYNIDTKPKLCYNGSLVGLHGLLGIVGLVMQRAAFVGSLENVKRELILNCVNDVLFKTQATRAEYYRWASRGITKAISIIRYLFSWQTISPLSISCYFFTQCIREMMNSQNMHMYYNIERNNAVELLAKSRMNIMLHFITTRFETAEIMKLANSHEGILLEQVMEGVMNITEKVTTLVIQEHTIQGNKLYQELCALYGSAKASGVTTQQFIEWILDLGRYSAHSCVKEADVYNVKHITLGILQEVFRKQVLNGKSQALNTWVFMDTNAPSWQSCLKALTYESKILTSCFVIDLASNISKFLKEKHISRKSCEDEDILNLTRETLANVMKETVDAFLRIRITGALVYASQKRTVGLVSRFYGRQTWKNINNGLNRGKSVYITRRDERLYSASSTQPLLDHLNKYRIGRVSEYKNDGNFAESRIISRYAKINFTIMDTEGKLFSEVWSPGQCNTLELVYYLPCYDHPAGHYNAYVNGAVVDVEGSEKSNCFQSAICKWLEVSNVEFAFFSNEAAKDLSILTESHAHEFANIFVSVEYSQQLKEALSLLPSDFSNQIKCEPIEYQNIQFIDNNNSSNKNEKLTNRQYEDNDFGYVPRENIIEESIKYCKQFNRRGKSIGITKASFEILQLFDKFLWKNSSKEKLRYLVNNAASSEAQRLFSHSGTSMKAQAFWVVCTLLLNRDISKSLKLCFIGHQMSLRHIISNAYALFSDHQISQKCLVSQ